MKNKIFNKYVLIFFILVLLFASGIKIHSFLTVPNISDWNYRQLQKIDNSKTDFSFAVMGDNRDGDAIFKKIIKDINKDKSINFALNNGDLVPDGYTGEFKDYVREIKNSKVPILSIIGNHDIPWYDGGANYKKFFGKNYFSFHTGKNYFIILDDSNEKNIDNEQFIWLKKELKISQNYQNRFVFMHVPLYDPRKGDYKEGHSLSDINNAKRLNDLFDENNVTMLFCSHIHFYYKGKWQKTPFIITGGAGAPLKDYKNNGFYNYIKVSINGSEIKYDVIKIENPALGRINKLVSYTWNGIYTFFANQFIEIIILTALVYISVYAIITKWNWVIRVIRKIKK